MPVHKVFKLIFKGTLNLLEAVHLIEIARLQPALLIILRVYAVVYSLKQDIADVNKCIGVRPADIRPLAA
jgi:hypothetical protein